MMRGVRNVCSQSQTYETTTTRASLAHCAVA